MNVTIQKMKLAGINTAFMAAVAAYMPLWKDAVLESPSTSDVETYAWLGDVAQIAEWKDELQPKGFAEYEYTIKNKRFAGAIEVEVDDLGDDKYGQILQRTKDLAEKAKAFPGKLLSDLRANGHTGLAYDGLPFFGTTRPGCVNLITGGGVASVSAIQTDFDKAEGELLSMKTDTGDTLVRDNPRYVVVCAPKVKNIITKALKIGTTDNGGENMYYGTVTAIEVDQYLTGNSWYVEDRAPRIKGFVHQTREAATLKNTDPNGDLAVTSDKIIFRTKSRENMGYGLPHHVVKISNS